MNYPWLGWPGRTRVRKPSQTKVVTGGASHRGARSRSLLAAVFVTLAAVYTFAPVAIAPAGAQSLVPGLSALHLSSNAALTGPRDGDPLLPFTTESGLISLSLDGIGTNNPAGGPVMVHKNVAGATVRKAYLFAASTGFSGYTPVNGDVTIDGTPVDWNPANTISNDIDSVNVEADVTSIVKEKIDAAPAGNVEFNVAEPNNTLLMDGEILAVILNDPSVKQPNSVTLLYGAQNPAGDSFHVGLAEPVNKSNPAFALNLSLGISFGYQTALETSQFSIVHVNEKLLTQMAGGQDDCFEKYSATPNYPEGCPNGTLLTVGGIGDSTNDPNPNQTLAECAAEKGEPVARCDDELYSLLPFVNNGEKELSFETLNPSDNDNIFFAALETHANAAVVGEGITLSPTTATNKVGELHTLTATVQNEHGEKLAGKTVHFEVVSGPNAGLKGESITETKGEAKFSYTSKVAGTDHIVATFTDAESVIETSNEVTKTWEEAVVETGPQLDGIASAQQQNEATAKLSTKESGDLIVAFVAADSPYTQGQISTVSGGGLAWTLAARENNALGGAEVWTARASGVLSDDPITAKVTRTSPGSPSGQSYDETITVAAFKNSPGIGAVGTSFGKKGAASGTLTTTKPNSWVWAIGDDWLRSVPRTVPGGQTLWHQATDAVGDTYWVQSTEGLTKAAGTPVTLNDPAPANDPFDMVLVEVL
jgi:Bacterial Ig-like domain (group 1)